MIYGVLTAAHAGIQPADAGNCWVPCVLIFFQPQFFSSPSQVHAICYAKASFQKSKPINKINVHVVSLYSATSPRQGSAAAAGGWSLRVDGLWRDESILVTTWCKEKEGRRERERGGQRGRERDRVLTAGLAGDGDDAAGAGAGAGAADGAAAAAAAFSVFSASAGFAQLLTRPVTPPLVTGKSCKKRRGVPNAQGFSLSRDSPRRPLCPPA